MNVRSRVLPTGGSAILSAWRQMHGPEHLRQQGSALWAGGGGQRLQMLAGPDMAVLRSYMAASNDRLVADMASMLGDISGNAEVRMGLKVMRRKSRQLAIDNEWVKRFLQLCRDNVAGPRGFAFQSKIYKARRKNGARELDQGANDTIEAAYDRMSRLGTFSACGKFNRASFERAAITCLARDGEVIVEKLIGQRFGPFGLAWRFIDPDLLDDTLNIARGGAYPGYGRLEQGNEIRMGVERDAFGRPVAYWFLQVHPGDDVRQPSSALHRRITADRVIHAFLAEDLRPDTARGVPWVYAAIRRMAMLGGYEEAALVNARTGASKMGWFVPPAQATTGSGALAETGAKAVADGEDAAGNLTTEAEPGTFGKLPPGWDFKTWDPAYPHDGMDPFVKAMLRAFSSSVGLTYNTIGNDLAGVSLSAMRHGANQDRDTYEAIQHFVVEHLCVPMFEAWLGLGLDFGRIGTLPADAFERLNCPKFIARPFRSPDPQKDVAAGAQKVALGVTSRTRLCAEEGLDIEQVFQELADEEAMAKDMGVTLNTAAATAHKNPPADSQGPKSPDGSTEPDDDETDTPSEEETAA